MSQPNQLARTSQTRTVMQEQVELFSTSDDMRYTLYAAWVECEVDPSELLDALLEELLH